VRPREGVGLEPGDVHDGLVRVDRLVTADVPLAPVVRPVERVRDVVLLLPPPRLLRPQLPALVAAALHEGQEGGVVDRPTPDVEGLDLDTMARALVVVGEAAVAGPELHLATRHLDRLETVAARARRRRRAARRPVSLQAGQVERLQHRLAVLLLVAHDQLVHDPVARPDAPGDAQRPVPDALEVLARLPCPQERQAAPPGPGSLEGVVDLGQVRPLHRLTGEAVHQPEVLERGDVPQVPGQGTHQVRVDALEVGVRDPRHQGERPLPSLAEPVDERLGIDGGGRWRVAHVAAGRSLPGLPFVTPGPPPWCAGYTGCASSVPARPSTP
jgi:hypothetical protein